MNIALITLIIALLSGQFVPVTSQIAMPIDDGTGATYDATYIVMLKNEAISDGFSFVSTDDACGYGMVDGAVTMRCVARVSGDTTWYTYDEAIDASAYLYQYAYWGQ